MTEPARILLAEDEQSVAGPIIARLESDGHTIHWVTGVRDLRAELPQFQPDLLLLDVTLDTDGLEFFQAVRFAPEHPRAGVVVLTEPGDVRMKERAQQLGAAAVMPKPVDGDQLVALVEDLLTFI